MGLPKLYKRTATGAIQTWEISVDGRTICTRWGQQDGQIQETKDLILAGKNLDKKNATTPEQQASLEAQARHLKQKKKGYVESLEAALEGAVDAVIEGGIAPMLAHSFAEHGHKLKWPAYVQPKLDGHRCIAVYRDGQCTLWSRTRKPITSVPHIVRALEMALVGRGMVVLDGELYVHELRHKFEELTSILRQREPKPGHDLLEFHIYDLPSSPADFHTRYQTLRTMFAHNRRPLRLVETHLVADSMDITEWFDSFVEQGYEGAIARNSAGLYESRRSYNLLKIKEFEEAEFPILGVEEGRGKLSGHAIFVCGTATGEFGVKLKGEQSVLKRYFEDPSLVIGRALTVKFQGRTSAGLPRFPVGVRLRQDL